MKDPCISRIMSGSMGSGSMEEMEENSQPPRQQKNPSGTKIYGACIRPVILYGAESWALTKKLKELIYRCDCRMLRYMAGVKWEEGLS